MSKKRIPSLDGLRGCSIWAVLLAHMSNHYQRQTGRSGHILHVIAATMAYLGVTVFFVISGFLITGILSRGKISLQRFYTRRAVRILPAALVYILVVLALGHARPMQAVYALTFTTTFVFEHAYRPLQQLWSLSVEECFYILWPFAMLYGPKAARRVGWCVVFLAPLLRIILKHYGYPETTHLAPAIADSLVAGCLFALYREELFDFARRRLARTSTFIALSMATICMALLVFANGLVALWFLVLLLVVLTTCSAIVRESPILNRGPLAWCGLLSYSLYLWQQPFLVMPGPLDILPIRLALTFAVAYLSYRFIEQPALMILGQAEARRSTIAPSKDTSILALNSSESV